MTLRLGGATLGDRRGHTPGYLEGGLPGRREGERPSPQRAQTWRHWEGEGGHSATVLSAALAARVAPGDRDGGSPRGHVPHHCREGGQGTSGGDPEHADCRDAAGLAEGVALGAGCTGPGLGSAV